jgi:DNA-binding response OmpR family regulator
MKILLAEDDLLMAKALCALLSEEHWEVEHVEDGEAALRAAFVRQYDLLIIDLMLPVQDGSQVLKHLRDANMQTPVIILTGLADVENKVRLLGLGADDYLVKPVAFAELKARILAAMRKQKIEAGKHLNYQDIYFDLERHEVVRAGQKIELREKQINILQYFLMHPEQVLTREMILNYVWGPTVERYTNVVDVHIHHLREKIDKPYSVRLLKTVNSVGYKLSK